MCGGSVSPRNWKLLLLQYLVLQSFAIEIENSVNSVIRTEVTLRRLGKACLTNARKDFLEEILANHSQQIKITNSNCNEQ